VVARTLDQFGLEHPKAKRWSGLGPDAGRDAGTDEGADAGTGAGAGSGTLESGTAEE
jgi:hypothetical protein